MDLSITDEERAVAETVRAFVEREVLPWENLLLEREANGGSPGLTRTEVRSLQAKAKESGLWGVGLPDEYGGAGLSRVMQVLIAVELGRTFVNFNFGGNAMVTLYDASEEQKQHYLYPTINGELQGSIMISEPGVGSDARGIKTTAVRDGDEWVVNGEKSWISGGMDCDYGVVICRTPYEGDEAGISAFLIDRDMGYKSTPLAVMGSQSPATIVFQDVRVPSSNLLGQVNHGFQQFAMGFLHSNRMLLAAHCVGAMERLLEIAVAWAETRVTFGEPLSQRENIQWMIADGEVACRAAKFLCLQAGDLYDRGLDHRHASNSSKLFAAQASNKVADDVLQILGGMGYASGPVERYYRDLRVFRIFEGTDEMQRMAIQRNIFKRNVRIGQIG